MKKQLIASAVLLLTAFLFSINLKAQNSKVEGRIADANTSISLPGATIMVISTGKSIAADLDGKYVITIPASVKTNIRISAVGYNSKLVEDIEVKEGQLLTLNVVLEQVRRTETGVEVRSSVRKETTGALIAVQKNTSVVAQVVSAEAIRRSPDKNTGEVLKRVPGASVQDGKFLVIRGLSDRYNQAMLNGILLSSTEPDRKTFSFDIFPSAMIENIIINKTFVPELPGEWAGGLVQVQTKDVPSSSFLNIVFGTGFNSNTIGKSFLQSEGGKWDWLGIADNTRAMPEQLPLRYNFSQLNTSEKTNYGKLFRNVWSSTETQAPLNTSFQINGGANTKLFGRKLASIIALTYSNSNRQLPFDNLFIANNEGDVELSYQNKKYSRDILAGGLANFTYQLNKDNKITFKNIINVNSSDYVIDRFDGRDYIVSGGGSGDRIKAIEIGFRQNTFFNTQLTGEHNLSSKNIKLRWYGGFNILDQYIPDQRRLFYTQDGSDSTAPYYALLGLGAGQKSGSIFYSFLNDYIYNAGTDVSYPFMWKGKKQMLKAGYMFQEKDRIFDSRPFFINTASNALKLLPSNSIFNTENFGEGNDKLQFNEIAGNAFRYMANNILNAAYLQMDNAVSEKFRAVWGVRFESFDQLVGSKDVNDPRHVRSIVNDFLPGVNLTFKPAASTNIRLAASQTVVRPEFRELSPFAFYDFELGAQVVGNKSAKRTKVSNIDLRYEIYPRGGELFTVGVFYKYFDKPIEYYFNRTGPGSNTFNILNTDKAISFGSELEFRKKLDFISFLSHFTLSGNLSFIYSKVTDTTQTVNRPLQGQSPYLLNIGLQYDLEKHGIMANLLFNQIGRRILFVGSEAISDIWENPRGLLDIQLSKKVANKKGEIRFGINDLLNAPGYFYHDLDNNKKYERGSKDVLAIRRNYGTNFNLSFAYQLK